MSTNLNAIIIISRASDVIVTVTDVRAGGRVGLRRVKRYQKYLHFESSN